MIAVTASVKRSLIRELLNQADRDRMRKRPSVAVRKL
jgi:hypothetical protein